jgi:hypothetical protein
MLLDEFSAGKRWDPESGEAPVATEVSQVNGFERTIYRYQDGSINVAEVQEPSGTVTDGASPNAIKGCQSIAATGARAWVNCVVSWHALSWSVHFTAAYRYYLGPVYGCFIDSISGLAYGGAGSFSNGNLSYITRSGSGYSTECRADGTVQRSTPIFSEIVGVEVHVSAQHGGGSSSKVSS